MRDAKPKWTKGFRRHHAAAQGALLTHVSESAARIVRNGGALVSPDGTKSITPCHAGQHPRHGPPMTERLLDAARALVLSLRPRFAEAILSGTKTVEVRRVMPRITDPTLALLYASGREGALVGTCVVRSVARYPTDELWRWHGADTALSMAEFDAYLDGRDSGVALLLERPEPLAAPIPLHTLRQAHGFRPPQSFAYVSYAQRKRLLAA